jgi:hypothetical protein
MSKGLGRIQRGCLRVIENYEAEGQRPTTFNTPLKFIGSGRISAAIVWSATHSSLQPSGCWLRSIAWVLSPSNSILNWLGMAAASAAVPGRQFAAIFRWNGPRDSLSGGCIQANSTTMHQNAPVSRAESPGRLVLESKEDLRKRGMPSPDEGDTVALCFTEPGGVVFHRAVHHYQEPDLDWVV